MPYKLLSGKIKNSLDLSSPNPTKQTLSKLKEISERLMKNRRPIASTLAILVLIVGLISATNLAQQSQDVREQAKSTNPANTGLINPPREPLAHKVMVIAYDTHNDYPSAGYTDPMILSQQLAAGINTASIEKGFDIPNTEVQLVETYTYNTPLPPGGFCDPTGPCANFDQIFSQHNVCGKINQGTIDEVWIWTGGSETNGGRLNEVQMAGYQPFLDDYNTWTINRTDCNHDFTVMGLNYETGWEQALHSFAHRFEYIVTAVLDSKNIGDVVPGDNWYAFDGKIGYDGQLDYGNTCGNAHWAPNATSLFHDYDFNLINQVVSKCNDWNPQLTGQSSVFDCAEWECNSGGYYTWWLKSMPGLCNSVGMTKLNGQPMPNWWKLILDYEPVFETETCPIPDPIPPDCTNFSIPLYHDQGDTIQVSCDASDADGNVNRVEFYYASEIDWLANQCSTNWIFINTDTSGDGGTYSVLWNTTNVPEDRYVVIARVYDNSGLSCTGNPQDCGEHVCTWAAGNTTSPLPPEDCYYCDGFGGCEIDLSCTVGNMTLQMCEASCQTPSGNSLR